jgi:2,5-furandicarboxylate decarboxylase 1
MGGGFRKFLKLLEEKGEILRIPEPLSPVHEIPAVMRMMDNRSKKVAFFENVKGYAVPVVWNILGADRLATAMDLEPGADVSGEFYRRAEKPIEPKVVKQGPVVEVPVKELDVLKTMPVLTHHAKDVSPYFTSAVSIAKDPETGLQSMGIHRVQVKGPNKLGIFLGSPPLSDFFKKAEALGRDLEIAIVVGIHPLTWLASVTYAPSGVNKFDIAGALQQEAIEVVRCRTVDLTVPAEAEFLIEAKVLAGVRETEGPFGESSGVYCAYQNPVAEVLAISHRADPIYHALLPYTLEEVVLRGIAFEPQITRVLQTIFPWVARAHLDDPDWTRLIIQIAKPNESAPRDLLTYALENFHYTKTAVVVDRDIDLYDPRDVAFALANRMQPDKDVLIKSNVPTSKIDPSAMETAEGYRGSKIGFDATMPLVDNEKYEKIRMPDEVDRKIERLLRSYL